ncbi:MAG: hypothetical protein IJY09_01280 [Lachnospiraceae bacterium]|nr:hypothetical protein [Lachnospiraceae bacterium]
MYRNARPIDLARWQYHFENGTQEAVLAALEVYQNPDGGFGHALEADCFNPNSSPIQTWAATEVLREIGWQDAAHPIVQGILCYLESGADFDTAQNQWLNCVPTNNEYPHAIWWEYKAEQELRYNPTAALAGFVIRFGKPQTSGYQKAQEMVQQAYAWFNNNVPFQESHTTNCFITMYEYLTAAGVDWMDLEELKQKLILQVEVNICHETEKWGKEYVALPSNMISGKNSMFYESNKEIAEKECDFIRELQQVDGAFPVTWQWWTEYREFELAANWWKADFCVKNLRYCKRMGRL